MEPLVVLMLVVFGVIAAVVKMVSTGDGSSGGDSRKDRGRPRTTVTRTTTVQRTRRVVTRSSTADAATADRSTATRGSASSHDRARAAALAAVASVLAAAAARPAAAARSASTLRSAAGARSVPESGDSEEIPPEAPRTEPAAFERNVSAVYTPSASSYSVYTPTSVYESGASILDEDESSDALER